MADEEAAPQPVWEGPLDADGLPHGEGRMSYVAPPPANEEAEEKPGDTYTGTMEHGVRHGRGKYTFGASGAAFEGQYVNGQKQGHGIMKFPDGSKYEGTWEADVMGGEGTYTYKSGDIFHGTYKAGKEEGRGVYHCKADNCQFHGMWQGGEFVEGKWVYRDGSMFAGTFEASKPAQGTHYFSGSGLLQGGRYVAGGAWQGTEVTAGTAAAVL